MSDTPFHESLRSLYSQLIFIQEAATTATRKQPCQQVSPSGSVPAGCPADHFDPDTDPLYRELRLFLEKAKR